MTSSFPLFLALAGLISLVEPAAAQPAAVKSTGSAKADASGWIPLFDGKTLSGWSAPDAGRWEVIAAGELVGQGPVSHLFRPGTYTNLEFKADVKLNHSGNSGMYFRAARGTGWPKGYEAQVENTS